MLELRRIVDRYRVDAHLDRGASADLYRVTHVWLHLPMVLKHLRDDAPPELRTTLVEEARIQCEVVHHNLVAAHDALEIDGRPAVVLEFVDGPDLAAWIDARRRPDVGEALALFRGIAAGVAEVHRQGFIHRDLKPENVLLAARPDGGYTPKVADFGLAKRLRNARGRRHSLSTTFTLIGTPEYMAPEQVRDPGGVDRRSDIFSLGAILYEMVTGQVAFEHDDAQLALDRIATGKYTRPRAVRPDLSPELERLVVRMLALEPERRPASCEEVLDALAALP